MNEEQKVFGLVVHLLNTYPEHRVAIISDSKLRVLKDFQTISNPRLLIVTNLMNFDLNIDWALVEHVVVADNFDERIECLIKLGVSPINIVIPTDQCRDSTDEFRYNLHISSIVGLGLDDGESRSDTDIFVDRVKEYLSNVSEGSRTGIVPFGKYARALQSSLGNDPRVVYLDNRPCSPAIKLTTANLTEVQSVIVASLSFGAGICAQLAQLGHDERSIVNAFCQYDQVDRMPIDDIDIGALEKLASGLSENSDFGKMAIVLSRPSHKIEEFLRLSAISSQIVGFYYRDLTRIKINHSADDLVVRKGVHELLQTSHDCVLDLSRLSHRHAANTIWLGEKGCLKGPVKYYFPYASEGSTSFSQYIASEKPLVYLSTAFAGSGRISPVIEALSSHFGKSYQCTPVPVPLRRQLLEPDFNIRDWLVSVANGLTYNQVFDFHSMTTDDVMKGLLEVRGVNVLMVMRDPRDILTSWALMQARSLSESFETIALRYMNAILSVSRSFCLALKCPHMQVIRFEDVHENAVLAYRKILRWLNWEPNLFISLSDKQLDDAIQLGSIEFQTGGLLKRGGDGNSTVFGIRKGVVGDWVNHWTPLVKASFLDKGGDEILAALGYEASEK